MKRIFACAALGFALVGCANFIVTQESLFSDEDGNVISVAYGHSDSECNTPYVSPVTGEEIDFKSKLRVKVTLPDGDGFSAWQCMNVLRSGTMYKSTNGKWMYHANGITCSVYTYDSDKDDYLLVFQGVICQGPKRDRGKR